MPSVLQEWVMNLSMMQQTVLLTALRGPDGLPKYGAAKLMLRWFRRCILLSAIDGRVLDNPVDVNGGSFTGPSTIESRDGEWQSGMSLPAAKYLQELDGIPHHFHTHFMHAIDILVDSHPDTAIREWWHGIYVRFVNDLHLHPETMEELDERLGDSRDGWLKRADPATSS